MSDNAKWWDLKCQCSHSVSDHQPFTTDIGCASCGCTMSKERVFHETITRRENENAALRAAAAYVLRVGAIDPDTPPSSIRIAAIGDSLEGMHDRITAAEREWDKHTKVLKGER